MTMLQCALLLASVVVNPSVGGDGWLGVILADSKKAVVAEVVPDSPAEEAGLRPRDVFLALDGRSVDSLEAFAAAIGAREAGDEIRVRVRRGTETREISVVLSVRPGAEEQPKSPRQKSAPERVALPSADRGYLGIRMVQEGGGLILTEVVAGGPAARAGVKPGGRLVRIGEHRLRSVSDLDEVMRRLTPGQSVEFAIRRGASETAEARTYRVEVGMAPGRSVASPAPGAAAAVRPSARDHQETPRLVRLREQVQALRREVAELTRQLEEAARRRGQ